MPISVAIRSIFPDILVSYSVSQSVSGVWLITYVDKDIGQSSVTLLE